MSKTASDSTFPSSKYLAPSYRREVVLISNADVDVADRHWTRIVRLFK